MLDGLRIVRPAAVKVVGDVLLVDESGEGVHRDGLLDLPHLSERDGCVRGNEAGDIRGDRVRGARNLRQASQTGPRCQAGDEPPHGRRRAQRRVGRQVRDGLVNLG